LLLQTRQAPTILRSHLEGNGKKLIIDLSIPYNVEQPAQDFVNGDPCQY
jgi:glutamyl-tRNA reductase